MTYFLREVFEPVSACANSIIEKIDGAYLYLGYMMWRATQDESFLAIPPTKVDSPILQKAIGLYDLAKNQAQQSLNDGIAKKIRGGDHGPKPDMKPGLMAIVQNLTPFVAKIGFGHPVMALGTAIIACAMAYTLSHTGIAQTVQDTVATVYGTTNGQRPKPPRLD